MEFLEEESSDGVQSSKSSARVSKDKKKIIFEALLKHSVNGKVKHGSIKDVANLKRIEIKPEDVARIPLNRRTTIRTMASALNMSKTSLHRRVKEGSLKPHSNSIKPMLTEENRKKYYLLPEEEEPYRTCKSKKSITKVMFLCVVARPRFDLERNEMFDGKIGMLPFVYKEAAKRGSKNREAGTLETKPIESVNKEVTRKWLIDYVLPAIRAKWPPSSSKTIYIQQDNARPHISVNDVEFLEAAQKDGFDIHLTCQHPNSPDMNALDLCFFRALQSLQYQESPWNVDELVAATIKAFDEISVDNLSNVFLTLQLTNCAWLRL
nr:Transposase, Tc1-like protein [Ipomoea batatas]